MTLRPPITAIRFLHALLLAALACPALAAQTAAQRLEALAEEMVEREFDLFPSWEAYAQGPGPRAARAVVDLAPGWKAREQALYRDVLDKLGRIRASELSAGERVNYEQLKHRAEGRRARAGFPLREIGLLIPSGGGLLPSLIDVAASTQPLRNEADFEAWLARVQASAPVFDHAIAALRSAARQGWTTSRPLVEKAMRQVEAVASVEADQGPFWGVMARYPRALSAERRAAYEARYRAALEGELLPAMRRLARYLREEYVEQARQSAGLGALPGGDRAYRALVRDYTTLDLDPDEIHKLGLEEVARVRAKLLEVARSLGFKGGIRDFAGWYQAHPDTRPFNTADEVLAYLRRVHQRVEPQLPSLFRRLPKAAFEIRLVDPAIAASASASYVRPLPDGSRPGTFRIPVTDPKRVVAFGLTALLLHEGMPGHHLDLGRMVELDLPRFRKVHSLSVYSEGWGLYAESLGHDLGVYDDPWALLGRYTAELHRSARLVVDTGMHAKGWSRDQAIRYLVEERGAPETSAIVAIERYMGSPGQALTYKVGELEILKLRAQARRELGGRFDLRDFHEAVLGAGPLTLPQLRERVGQWVARERRGA